MHVLVELIGWAAAAFTLVAYSSRTMLPLRTAAVFANVTFIAYSAFLMIWPTLILHLALLPLNGFRLWQLLSLRRRVRNKEGGADTFGWIAKVQAPADFDAGTPLFHAGDPADWIYYLVSGKVRLPELGISLEPGAVFGEIAFFADPRVRTVSAICETDCRIVLLDETRFITAYHQDPTFGLAIVRLVARRLVENAQPGPSRRIDE